MWQKCGRQVKTFMVLTKGGKMISPLYGPDGPTRSLAELSMTNEKQRRPLPSYECP